MISPSLDCRDTSPTEYHPCLNRGSSQLGSGYMDGSRNTHLSYPRDGTRSRARASSRNNSPCKLGIIFRSICRHDKMRDSEMERMVHAWIVVILVPPAHCMNRSSIFSSSSNSRKFTPRMSPASFDERLCVNLTAHRQALPQNNETGACTSYSALPAVGQSYRPSNFQPLQSVIGYIMYDMIASCGTSQGSGRDQRPGSFL